MGAKLPYYLPADSADGQAKEAGLTETVPGPSEPRGDIRKGLVYERVPHVTLKSMRTTPTSGRA